MKSFSRAIDRFCRSHPGFGITRLMLVIVIGSGAVAIVSGILAPPAANAFLSALVFHPGRIMSGQIWRLVTWVFIPQNAPGSMNGLLFTAIALYFYYFIGSALEREWGSGRFTAYYLLGILLHVVYGFISYYLFKAALSIYPMYLNLSMFFAFAVLFPDFTVRLMFLIPIKIKWLAIINAAFFLFSLISTMISGYILAGLLPLVALLNFFIMCGDQLLANIRPVAQRAAYNSSAQVINFKKEAKKAKQEADSKPYRHICAVCGKTDTQFPDTQFRYCSRCNGYHCFCDEHINNHIHFS